MGSEMCIRDSRVSVMLFKGFSTLNIKFSKYKTHADFSRGVDNLPYSGGGTNIYRALRKALDQMFKSENGTRHESSKMMILITDGESNDSQFNKLRNEFQDRKIALLVIGVGNVNEHSLRKLVTDEKDLFIADNFDDLNKRYAKSVGQRLHLCTGAFLPYSTQRANLIFPSYL